MKLLLVSLRLILAYKKDNEQTCLKDFVIDMLIWYQITYFLQKKNENFLSFISR